MLVAINEAKTGGDGPHGCTLVGRPLVGIRVFITCFLKLDSHH